MLKEESAAINCRPLPNLDSFMVCAFALPSVSSAKVPAKKEIPLSFVMIFTVLGLWWEIILIRDTYVIKQHPSGCAFYGLAIRAVSQAAMLYCWITMQNNSQSITSGLPQCYVYVTKYKQQQFTNHIKMILRSEQWKNQSLLVANHAITKAKVIVL